ncbi:MAG TPA: phosphodiester glycosidase family protein, partial [Labilithrix sp.]|nr:phosphodiester glycosidase family protein [Labilithrix sp.]
MKGKRKVVRLAFFGAIVAVPFALALASRKARRGDASGGLSSTPAGGVAQADAVRAVPADGGSASDIVEDGRRYEARVWSFGLERHELRIEDAGMTTALDEVLARTGAELVVNGGFFDPEGKPVGLAISNGAVLSRLGKNLSGGVLTSDGAHAELFPAESFALPDGGSFAIQCRPRLVVDHSANVKSDDGKRAERTALCIRDLGRTVDVVVVRGSDDGVLTIKGQRKYEGNGKDKVWLGRSYGSFSRAFTLPDTVDPERL